MSINKQGKELSVVGFGEFQPFTLMLSELGELKADAVLRIIPGRRMVVAGVWQNKRVVAKLFFDKRHAERHIAAEIAGIKLLQERNVPMPPFYGQAKSEDGCVHALIFEYLHADIDLVSAWQRQSMRDDLLPFLKLVIVEIATQHVFGLTQRDLHLNNFLMANNHVYTLDGAQIEIYDGILPYKPSMQNLALLLSQLGVGAEHYQEALFRHYVKARGWIWKKKVLDELFFMIDLWSKQRWYHFSKKIFRKSTHFHRIDTWRAEAVCDRRYSQPEFMLFLQQPESAFSRGDAVMLKDGRSSTVIRLKLDGRDLVIKRYNLKNRWHWLRRCFRETRAKKCWRIAQKLRLFGVGTAYPVAYIETRFLGMKDVSYFVTEYVAGENIDDYLQANQHDSEKQNVIIRRICLLLDSLKKTAITHGDLKATNILINGNEEPILIDLDGAREHGSLNTLQRVSSKEWQRFLRNFDDRPELRGRFTSLV